MARAKQPRLVGEPRPPALSRRLERIEAERFLRHPTWEEVELIDPDLALVEAIEPRLTNLRIEGGDLGDAKLVHLTLDDSELVRVGAANVKAERAVLRRVRIEGARMTGTALGEAELADVRIEDSRLDYVGFGRARLVDVVFSRCSLRDVDFTGTRLLRVRFDGCDLTAAEFQDASFSGCEMIGCTIDDARSIASLRGVAMPMGDILASAPAFAAALGITVLEHDHGG
ncbi:MAG: pentapeptide repeat-containing protein [Solirubrobacteraceae bacterium]|nr:pentapeptide repeat-containing protein [Solirubrobacteraceae bacterium]